MKENRQLLPFLVVAGLFLTALFAYLFTVSYKPTTVAAAVSVGSSVEQEGGSQKTGPFTRIIYENHMKDVVHTVMRPILEERSMTVTYTQMNVVRDQVTGIDQATGKEITYTVARHVPEQREKIVNYVVTTMVPQQMHKTIGYTTARLETIERPTVVNIFQNMASSIKDWVLRCCSSFGQE